MSTAFRHFLFSGNLVSANFSYMERSVLKNNSTKFYSLFRNTLHNQIRLRLVCMGRGLIEEMAYQIEHGRYSLYPYRVVNTKMFSSF